MGEEKKFPVLAIYSSGYVETTVNSFKECGSNYKCTPEVFSDPQEVGNVDARLRVFIITGKSFPEFKKAISSADFGKKFGPSPKYPENKTILMIISRTDIIEEYGGVPVVCHANMNEAIKDLKTEITKKFPEKISGGEENYVGNKPVELISSDTAGGNDDDEVSDKVPQEQGTQYQTEYQGSTDQSKTDFKGDIIVVKSANDHEVPGEMLREQGTRYQRGRQRSPDQGDNTRAGTASDAKVSGGIVQEQSIRYRMERQGLQGQPRQGNQNQDHGKQTEVIQHGAPNYAGRLIVIVISLGIAVVALKPDLISSFLWPGSGSTPTIKAREDIFMVGLTSLESEYPQESKFWKVVRAATKRHIFDDDPQQPAVIMMASLKEAAQLREELAMEITKLYSRRCEHKEPTKVSGAQLEGLKHAKAKEEIDEQILAGFGSGSCAAIVSNFEKLPSPSTTIFYQFCENDSAPYKKVLIIFTLEISGWAWDEKNRFEMLRNGTAPEPGQWNYIVEEYLYHSLTSRDDSGKMTVDMIGGLLTRITPLVAWVKPVEQK